MRSIVHDQQIFIPHVESNRGLLNVFTNTKATTEQTHDLLNARSIGEQHYANYVTHHILQIPSVTKAPVRRKQLLTMAPPKITRARLTQKQKEERETNKYLRRRLAWCNQTGEKFDETQEQYTILPRAIADYDGNPHKGSKNSWTEKLKKNATVQTKHHSQQPHLSGLLR